MDPEAYVPRGAQQPRGMHDYDRTTLHIGLMAYRALESTLVSFDIRRQSHWQEKTSVSLSTAIHRFPNLYHIGSGSVSTTLKPCIGEPRSRR